MSVLLALGILWLLVTVLTSLGLILVTAGWMVRDWFRDRDAKRRIAVLLAREQFESWYQMDSAPAPRRLI